MLTSEVDFGDFGDFVQLRPWESLGVLGTLFSDKRIYLMVGFKVYQCPAVHVGHELPRGMMDAAHFYTVCSLFSAAEAMGTLGWVISLRLTK